MFSSSCGRTIRRAFLPAVTTFSSEPHDQVNMPFTSMSSGVNSPIDWTRRAMKLFPLSKTTFCMWKADRHGELSYDKRTPDNASEGVVAFQKFYLGTDSALDTDTAKRCGTVAGVLTTAGIGIGDLGYLPKTAADAMAQKLASDPPAQVMFNRIMETQISGKLRAAQPAPAPSAGPTFVSATIRQADGDHKTIFEQMLSELNTQESGPSDRDFLQFFPKDWSLSCLPRGDVVITTVKCASKIQGRFFPGGDFPKSSFLRTFRTLRKREKCHMARIRRFRKSSSVCYPR